MRGQELKALPGKKAEILYQCELLYLLNCTLYSFCLLIASLNVFYIELLFPHWQLEVTSFVPKWEKNPEAN